MKQFWFMSKTGAFLLFTLRLRLRYAQGERGLIRVHTQSVHEPPWFAWASGLCHQESKRSKIVAQPARLRVW